MTASMNKQNKLYKTADLPQVAALSVHGFAVKDVERSNTQRVFFLFNNSKQLEEFVAEYWKGRIKVEPQNYFNQLKLLKGRIYQT